MAVSVPSMLSAFFGDFRRFAAGLDSDCATLRAQLDGAGGGQTPHDDGASAPLALTQSLREMQAEAAELQVRRGGRAGGMACQHPASFPLP